jgi:hypothetical protein
MSDGIGKWINSPACSTEATSQSRSQLRTNSTESSKNGAQLSVVQLYVAEVCGRIRKNAAT